MIIKKVFLIIFFYFYQMADIYSNVIYSKDDIVITESDLKLYNKYYNEIYGDNFNEFQLIKNIVLVKKIIKKLLKTNPGVLDYADKIIIQTLGEGAIANEEIRDFNRFVIIKNEYIKEYFDKFINQNDLKTVVDNLKKLRISLSVNNCLTLEKQIPISDIDNFEKIIYEKILNKEETHYIIIKNIQYMLCFDSNLNYEIENELTQFMNLEISDDFNKYLYD